MACRCSPSSKHSPTIGGATVPRPLRRGVPRTPPQSAKRHLCSSRSRRCVFVSHCILAQCVMAEGVVRHHAAMMRELFVRRGKVPLCPQGHHHDGPQVRRGRRRPQRPRQYHRDGRRGTPYPGGRPRAQDARRATESVLFGMNGTPINRAASPNLGGRLARSSPDTQYEKDYRWLVQLYESLKPSTGTGRLLWHRLGAKTIQLIHENVHVEAVRDDLDTLVLDADLLEAVLGSPDPTRKAKPQTQLLLVPRPAPSLPGRGFHAEDAILPRVGCRWGMPFGSAPSSI
jgi:hypothetical protein